MRININKKIILSIIIILSITFISTISKAALEFKASTSTTLYQQEPSQAFQLCYDLKNADSSLGTNQVDPHLMLNKDWTAVSFLSMSTYGKGKTTATSDILPIDGGTWYSSNDNFTGVCTSNYNWLSDELTSSLTENYDGTTLKTQYTNIINKQNTRYVETIKIPLQDKANKGLGFGEGTNNTIPEETLKAYPLISRGTKYFVYGDYSIYNGSSSSKYFRPAIWNIDR